MTEESIRQQSFNDDLVKMKLQNISLNARPKVERRAITKPVVTQQQIDDYRKKLFGKPVIIGGKKYKYRPTDEEPILEDVNESVMNEIMTEEKLGEGREFILDASNDLLKNQEEIKKKEKEKQDFIYNVNNEPDYTTKKNIVKELEQRKKDIEKEIQSKQKLIIDLKKNTKDSIKNSKKIEEERDNINNLRKEIEDINDEIIRSKTNVKLDEDEIAAEIKKFDDEIGKQREVFKEIENRIVKVQNVMRQQDELKSINQAEEQRVKQINRERVKNYQERLNQLNEGEFSVIQQGNETEEEWLTRLNDVALSPYDDERIKLESDIYNMKELRKNLKEIIKDDVIIEDVIRSFNVVPNDVFQLNKIFNPYVKNKFIKVYGKFNPRIDEQTVYDFLSEILYEGKHGKKKENDGTDDIDNDVEVKNENLDKTSSSSVDEPKLGSVVGSMLNTAASMFADKLTGKPVELLDYNPPDEEEKADEEEKYEDTFIYSGDRFDIILSKKNNDLKIYSHDNQKEFFIKPATTAKGQPRFLISKTGNEGEFFLFGGEKGISTGADILDYLSVWSEVYGDGKANREAVNNRMDPPQLDYSIIKKYLGKSKVDVHANLRNYGLTNTTPKKKKIKYEDNREKFANLNNKELIGWGVGLPKDIPKELIPFGRCKLHLYKLYYDNEFVLKDSSGFNIPGLRNVKVSDEFVELIMKIHNKENISQSFINKLSKGEQDLYDLVIFKCGLKNLDIDHKTNVKKLKEKLATIEGEIEAGNDNKEVLKELYDVLQQLVIYRSINVSEAKKHYNSIKNDFF
jgi:hypothetical protein